MSCAFTGLALNVEAGRLDQTGTGTQQRVWALAAPMGISKFGRFDNGEMKILILHLKNNWFFGLWRMTRLTKHCAFFICVVGTFAGTYETVCAQARHSTSGTLVVKVPRGFLPSGDYWVYINSKIVSAPPHTPFPIPTRGGVLVEVARGSNSYELWDRNGSYAKTSGGYVTYVKSGMEAYVFQSQSFQLAPDDYDVELMTRNVNRKEFPFAVASATVHLTAGKSQTLLLGVPKSTKEIPDYPIPFRLMESYDLYTKSKRLELLGGDVVKGIEGFENSSIVSALQDVRVHMAAGPPSRPVIKVEFPDSFGGSRELDPKQLTLIIDELARDYQFLRRPELETAADANPRQADNIKQAADSLDNLFTSLREIITITEKVGRS